MMKNYRIVVWIGFLVCLTTSVMGYAAEDVAMVMDILHGKAFYQAGNKKGKEVVLVDFLTEGDKIKLAPQTTLILNYFASGTKEELTGPGTITVGKDSSKTEGKIVVKREKPESIPPKLQVSKAELQQFGATQVRQSEIKDGKMTLLSLKDSNTRSTQPVFRWQPVEKAETYWIMVSDFHNTRYLNVETKETTLTYPNSDLIRGTDYEWIVLAIAKGRIIATGEGGFSILTEASLKELERDEQAVKQCYPEETAGQMISLAILYQNYRLFDDAVAILRELRQQYPENVNIKNWLEPDE
jgi:hypothetical protein